MANAFDNTVQQWRTRINSGPVGKFFRWWLGELGQALPSGWQEKVQHALRRLTFRLENGDLFIGVEENRKIEILDRYPVAQEAPLQRQQINDLLIEKELLEVSRILLLDVSQVLRKEIMLPDAAEGNLFQVLSFEMDRQTPFRADDVYFGWRMLGHDKEAAQLRLELFVVPRAEVDRASEILAARGLAPSGVDILENGQTLGLNLLPSEKRVRVINRKARLNYALAAVAVVLLIVVMAQSLALRAHQVRELEEAIAEVRDEARLVQGIKDRISDTSEAAGFLTQRRSLSPLAVELLADITRLLPDDTYLDRLVIGQSNVQLQGKSQNAQQLIELVNESGLLQDAEFRGSTRLDARTGLEIFEVNANITGQAEG
jgi:general secretion pathway protein L